MHYLHQCMLLAMLLAIEARSGEPRCEGALVAATRPETGDGNRPTSRRQVAEDALVHLDSVFRFALCLTGGDEAEAGELVEDVFRYAVDSRSASLRRTDQRIGLLAMCRSRYTERDASRNSRADSDERSKSAPIAHLEALAETAHFAEMQSAGHDERTLPGLAEGEVMQAIARLPFRVREAVVRSDVEGLSYSGLSEVLGVGTDAAKEILFRGRRLLQQELYGQALERGDPEPSARSASASGKSSVTRDSNASNCG
jgi:DNA-directed RNA polymerase specialized sigma24 family protein